MKTVLFCISLLSVTSSFAQNMEVGVSGGGMFNKVLARGDYGTNEDQYFLTSVHAAYSSRHWQYRLAIGFGTHSKYSEEPMMGGLIERFNTKYTRVPVHFSVNRKVRLNRFELHSGFIAGVIFANNTRRYASEYNNSQDGSTHDFHWYSVGLNAGGTYFITKHIGMNLNAAVLYNNYDQILDGFTSFPVTVGVVYAFK